MRRVPRLLLTLVIGVAIGVGIGLLVKSLGSSESDKVSDAASGYLQAFADNDPAALCAHISPLARTRLQLNSQTCEQSAKTAIAQLPKAQRDALRNAEVTDVVVAGNSGNAQFTPKLAGRSDIELVKVGDEWLVNN